jgi:hypothetical protein
MFTELITMLAELIMVNIISRSDFCYHFTAEVNQEINNLSTGTQNSSAFGCL